MKVVSEVSDSAKVINDSTASSDLESVRKEVFSKIGYNQGIWFKFGFFMLYIYHYFGPVDKKELSLSSKLGTVKCWELNTVSPKLK